MPRQLDFRILGPLEVRREGVPVEIPSGRQRALLLLLLLHANEVVASDELVEQLWYPSPPPTARASLQNHVSRLRRLLGDQVIETVTPGYRANVDVAHLDLARVETLLETARGTAPIKRAALLREALACWRGLPLVEFPSEPFAQVEIVRLEELRLLALEERVDAELELGYHAELVPELESVVIQQPLRERLWRQLMLALYGAGRQAEALATYRRAHEVFVEELGIEPGPALRELQRAILVQDRRLDAGGTEPTDVLVRAASLLPTRTLSERAASLLEYSIALWRIGERNRATSVLDRAVDEAARGGDRGLEARARLTLAAHRWARGEIGCSDYLNAAERAVATVEATADERTLAQLLSELGIALRLAGRAAESAANLERSVALAHRAGDPWQEGWSRNLLGISWALGPLPASRALDGVEQQLEALEWGPPGPIGLWAALGMLHSQLGDRDAARSFALRAVEAAREGGLPVELAAMHTLAAAALELFDDDGAETHLRAADDLLAAADATAAVRPGVQAELARHALRRGAVETAEGLLAAARNGLRDDALVERVVVGRAAALLEARREGSRARELARAAVELAFRTDFLNLQGGALETLAVVEPQSDAREQAERVYEQKGNLAALTRVREL